VKQEHSIRVTQRVGGNDLVHLVSDPPRAAIAFATESGPMCVPVVVRRVDDEFLLGVDSAALPAAAPSGNAVLLVDDGRYWFELQAIIRRGVLEPLPEERANPLRWVRFHPQHEVAWDYGRLRQEPAE
jgi:hypothetical protein